MWFNLAMGDPSEITRKKALHMNEQLSTILSKAMRTASLMLLCKLGLELVDVAVKIALSVMDRPARAVPTLSFDASASGSSGASNTSNSQRKYTVALYHEMQLEELIKMNLTDQECFVALLLLNGERNQSIAKKMHLAESTVKFHVGNILKKSKTNSRHEFCDIIHADMLDSLDDMIDSRP